MFVCVRAFVRFVQGVQIHVGFVQENLIDQNVTYRLCINTAIVYTDDDELGIMIVYVWLICD